MSTPYGGNDPQQQPQWGQQPGYGQQPGGAQPPSGPQQQPQWGQQPQYDPSQTQQQQPQWGQQPAPYDPAQQQPGYPQSGPQQQPGYDPSQTQQQQPQWGQQPQYGQQPGYPQSGPQQQPGYPQSGPQQQPQYGGQQPGQYDYGQGQFQGTQGEAQDKPKSKKGLFIGIGALVVIIAAVGVLGFVTPGWFNTQVFNNTQMQTDVQKLLTETYQIPNVSAVSCPAGKEVKDGVKFTCTATIDGKPQEVPITVKGDTGNYEVSPPAVPK
ncbi:DUF4333 domain-containing protein [Amycolatopsis orientalis]|uniref:DUF4333 domain-containing protein n=1 Tax=Amycolatopsis orientalis TaxID=31958 RepID=UPI00041BD079|nr:DUF4333 domain-containing protein [Amycolatopsis orientalis]